METSNIQYCKCERPSSVYTENDDFGFWQKCSDCNKVIKDSYEYFNHYDGEDHVADI